MEQVIKLVADYQCFPLWKANGEVGNINPDDLPLTDDLKTMLRNWSASYDRTLNQDYPPDSAFSSPAEEETFEDEGKRLWQELQEQLGTNYKVIYKSILENRLYE
jgi:hypothetical protein